MFFSSSSLCHYRRWQGVTICWVQTDSSLLQLYCRAGLNTGFSGHLISPLPLFYLSTETSLNFLYTKPTRNVKLSGVQGLLRLYCELGSTDQISVGILNHSKNLNMSHTEISIWAPKKNYFFIYFIWSLLIIKLFVFSHAQHTWIIYRYRTFFKDCCAQTKACSSVLTSLFLVKVLPGTVVVHATDTVATAAAVVWPLWPHHVAFIAQFPAVSLWNDKKKHFHCCYKNATKTVTKKVFAAI